MTKNKVVRLAGRPHGPVKREDFTIEGEAMPEPGDGEFRTIRQIRVPRFDSGRGLQ